MAFYMKLVGSGMLEIVKSWLFTSSNNIKHGPVRCETELSYVQRWEVEVVLIKLDCLKKDGLILAFCHPLGYYLDD